MRICSGLEGASAVREFSTIGFKAPQANGQDPVCRRVVNETPNQYRGGIQHHLAGKHDHQPNYHG